IVTDSPLTDRLGSHDAETFCVDREASALAALPATVPTITIHPHHPAYIIYTSGSTGLPKGIVVEHGGIPNLASAQANRFAIRSESRVLQFSSLSFDASVSELATVLTTGAALVLTTGDHSQEGLARILRKHVTHATLPPALLAELSQDLPIATLVFARHSVPP